MVKLVYELILKEPINWNWLRGDPFARVGSQCRPSREVVCDEQVDRPVDLFDRLPGVPKPEFAGDNPDLLAELAARGLFGDLSGFDAAAQHP